MRIDLVSGLVFAAVGGVLAIAGWRLPGGLAGVPGPGVFPMLIGSVMCLLGLGLAAASRAQLSTRISPGAPSARQVFAIVVLMACYVALWQTVPFVWRTPILLMAIYRVLGESGIRTVALAVAATAVLFGVFDGLLRVRL